MVTPTLTGATTLGKLQTERVHKTSGVVIFPFPLTDIDSNQGSGFNGALMDIDISGIITGVASDMNATRSNLMGLADPDPTSVKTYTSDLFTGGIGVLVIEVTVDYNVALPTVINYGMRLSRVSTII